MFAGLLLATNEQHPECVPALIGPLFIFSYTIILGGFAHPVPDDEVTVRRLSAPPYAVRPRLVVDGLFRQQEPKNRASESTCFGA